MWTLGEGKEVCNVDIGGEDTVGMWNIGEKFEDRVKITELLDHIGLHS